MHKLLSDADFFDIYWRKHVPTSGQGIYNVGRTSRTPDKESTTWEGCPERWTRNLQRRKDVLNAGQRFYIMGRQSYDTYLVT